jgi:hypothetical protein
MISPVWNPEKREWALADLPFTRMRASHPATAKTMRHKSGLLYHGRGPRPHAPIFAPLPPPASVAKRSWWAAIIAWVLNAFHGRRNR